MRPHKKKKRSFSLPPLLVKRLKLFFAVVFVLLAWYRPLRESAVAKKIEKESSFTKANISASIGDSLDHGEFPTQADVVTWLGPQRVIVSYTLDDEAQNEMEKIFKTYRPDYGAFVAMDASTGQILALVSYSRYPNAFGNLGLKALFPAASVFKIVTASAAIDRARMTPDSVIPFNGRNHTLYRKNVEEMDPAHWNRKMTLREAFGKSVNTVFGKLGAFFLKPEELEEYAKRFLFNRAIAADLPVEQGKFQLSADDPFAMAELASGFNRIALMSPLQGAMMAAAIANDGEMMEPYLIDSLVSVEDGKEVYHSEPTWISETMTPQSAESVRSLMREVITSGTSRQAFRDFLRKPYNQGIDIGGKTGHLTGELPRGKCDWFVGYARRGKAKIALAALTVNEENWRIKASYVARAFMEHYFASPLDSKHLHAHED